MSRPTQERILAIRKHIDLNPSYSPHSIELLREIDGLVELLEIRNSRIKELERDLSRYVAFLATAELDE